MLGLNIFFVSLMYNSNRKANLFLNIYFKYLSIMYLRTMQK